MNQLEMMRAEYEATTPEPWDTYNIDNTYLSIRKGKLMRVCDVPYDLGPGRDVANARFIAGSHRRMGMFLAVAEAAAWENWEAWADNMEARHDGIPVLRERMRAIAAAIAPLLEDMQ